jgi:uncharacterized repeat protein (TIGR03837 family)
MLWDLFCRVIDNYGDVGVCWRLARTLVGRGERVRLWLDDDQALRWMAPWQPGELAPSGVEVRPWAEAQAALDTDSSLQPGDVVIEAFGCELPNAFLARMAAHPERRQPPIWVNLEYLSAEDYVERSHRLQSPVMSGPGQGLRKWFFYPGFTARTGGLLRPAVSDSDETGARRSLREHLLSDLAAHPARSGQALPGAEAIDQPWVMAFCYRNAPLPTVLDALAHQAREQGMPPVHVWLTPGPATELGTAWLTAQGASLDATAGSALAARPTASGLRLHALPRLPQANFDSWLDACDLNLVRGEDSAVRALWPGRPHLWQLYVQDDGVHAEKMHAFTQRWMADWPQALRQDVLGWWRLWNGLTDTASLAQHASSLPVWWTPPGACAPSWVQAQQASARVLRTQADLATQLMAFVKHPG